MTKSNLLVTGFEPFDGYSTNPSAELVKRINGSETGRFNIIGEVLRLDYSSAFERLDYLIGQHKPEIVLLCGQAGRPSISIERIAINAVGTKRPDNYENKPESDIIKNDAPAAFFSNIDPHPLVRALVESEIPAFVSYHAGIYGCNWILFKLLDQISAGHFDLRTTFIHLPPLPSQAIEKDEPSTATMELDTMVRAIEVIIEQLSE
ncbi:MAG: pyroglutamyl-peptidase I [Candidatus Thorarchaeota archaeon]|nr:pyroglutamyl-peptidase I [Candidatus Thorarchaeota archaeon]